MILSIEHVAMMAVTAARIVASLDVVAILFGFWLLFSAQLVAINHC